MKTKTNLIACCLFVVGFLCSANTCSQAQASAAYVAAEVSAAAILQHNPALLPTMQLLVADWNKFQLGTLTAADEAGLLKNITAATAQKLSPTEAALLDGAVQQILANQNATAPTPLNGAAGAIITDVMNGVAREIVVYTTPAA
jgi:hypothetical protein